MKVWLYVSGNNHVSHKLKDIDGVVAEVLSFPKWLFLSVYVIRGGYDIIHFQYLQGRLHHRGSKILSFVKTLNFIVNILVIKFFGVKIVWTAHHTESHEVESSRLDWLGRQLLLFASNKIIALELPVKTQMESDFYVPSDIAVISLGNYRQLHIERNKSGDEAMELPDQPSIISMIGMLREYKRVPLGIQSTDKSMAERMLIAGKPRSTQIKEKIEKTISDSYDETYKHFGFISDKGLVNYVERTDATLILNNQDTVPATALLSASCRTPIVATPGGVKEYFIEEYGIGIVAKSDQIEDIADAIDDLLQEDINPDWESFDEDHNWQKYRNEHANIYQKEARSS